MSRPTRYAGLGLVVLVVAAVVRSIIIHGGFFWVVQNYPERTLIISLTSTDMIQPVLEQIRTFAESNRFQLSIVRHNSETIQFSIDMSRPDLEIIGGNETRVRRFEFSFLCPSPGVFGSQAPIAPKPELDHLEAELKDIASRIPGTSFQPETTASDGKTPFRGCSPPS